MINENSIRKMYTNTPAKYLPVRVGVGNSKHPEEFKRACISMLLSGSSVKNVAKKFNTSQSNIYNFKSQYEMGVFSL